MKNVDDTIARLEKYAGDIAKKKAITKSASSRGTRNSCADDIIEFDKNDEAIVSMWNGLKNEKYGGHVSVQ